MSYTDEELNKAMQNFDFNKLVSDDKQVQNNTIQGKVSASTEAVQISKRAKEADEIYNRKVKRSYASNYEKGLITIAEKHNGEL